MNKPAPSSQPARDPPAADGRLPIVVGVTGHRHLRAADLPAYRSRVVELFDGLRARYPATPLRIISALAAGADRLVAQIALERGHELIAPLPLEPEDYERDFPESVAEFRAILQRVPRERVFVWPRSDAAIMTSAPGRSAQGAPAAERDLRYAEVGAFVAEQCHILLAIWDGAPSEGEDSSAGTASVVALKLGQGGAMRPGTGLDPADTGPVFHVHAVRSGSDGPPAGRVDWLFPDDSDAALFHTVCTRLDRFNSEPLRSAIEPQVTDAANALLPGVERGASDDALAGAFAYADCLAARYQRITHRVMRLTLLLAAAMALLFEIYAEVLPLRPVPAGYLACFALLTVVLFWHRRLDAQGRYLDYRALAEGLRVQFYWRLAGLSDNASSSYLRKQLDELCWIREALRATGAVPAPRTAQPELTLKCWVHGQATYYAQRARLHEQRMRRIERYSQVFLALGLFSALSLVVFWRALERLTGWHHWAVLVMGFAPVAAALWEAYGERLGARTQANQYARFATIFRRAERFIDALEQQAPSASRRERERAVLRDLGREALIENADWVLLLRDRPIALPKG